MAQAKPKPSTPGASRKSKRPQEKKGKSETAKFARQTPEERARDLELLRRYKEELGADMPTPQRIAPLQPSDIVSVIHAYPMPPIEMVEDEE